MFDQQSLLHYLVRLAVERQVGQVMEEQLVVEHSLRSNPFLLLQGPLEFLLPGLLLLEGVGEFLVSFEQLVLVLGEVEVSVQEEALDLLDVQNGRVHSRPFQVYL